MTSLLILSCNRAGKDLAKPVSLPYSGIPRLVPGRLTPVKEVVYMEHNLKVKHYSSVERLEGSIKVLYASMLAEGVSG